MNIEPQAARFHIEPISDGLRAIIPARRNWFMMIFLMAWLVAWFFGAVSVADQLLKPGDKTPSAFLAFWLAGWTLGGAFTVSAVIWQLAGREVITINSSTLIHRAEAFGLGWNRSYRTSDVKNFRSTEYALSPFTNQRAWFPPVTEPGIGSVAFDYGACTIRMAPSLEEAEAKMLVRELSSKLSRKLSETQSVRQGDPQNAALFAVASRPTLGYTIMTPAQHWRFFRILRNIGIGIFAIQVAVIIFAVPSGHQPWVTRLLWLFIAYIFIAWASFRLSAARCEKCGFKVFVHANPTYRYECKNCGQMHDTFCEPPSGDGGG